jgi:hypothetical protein
MAMVGQAASISAGEWINASGESVNDRTNGRQFQARFLKTSARTSIGDREIGSASRADESPCVRPKSGSQDEPLPAQAGPMTRIIPEPRAGQ